MSTSWVRSRPLNSLLLLFVDRMRNQKLPLYINVARAIDCDEFYRIIILKNPNHLPEAFNEEEVVRFLRMSDHSSDRKLQMISDWAEANTESFVKADSVIGAFTGFLRHIDAANLSHSAINRFLLGDDLFASNRDCR